jgi:hypothetical protein
VNRNRIVYIMVGLALTLTTAFTVRQAVLTADTVFASSQAVSEGSDLDCSLSEAERATIQSVRLPQSNGTWSRTDAGYLGYEGGLMTVLDC